MMLGGAHLIVLGVYIVVALAAFLAPIIIGFAYVLPDADRLGQSGLLWAVLTIPLGWLALLGYLIARAFSSQRG